MSLSNSLPLSSDVQAILEEFRADHCRESALLQYKLVDFSFHFIPFHPTIRSKFV